MNKEILFRIILDILIVVCVVHGWWFVALPLAIFGVWKFTIFIEIIVAGVIYDSLFGFVPELYVGGYVGTVVSIVALGAVVLLKKVVRK